MDARLDPPQSVSEENSAILERVEREMAASAIKLSDKKRRDLERQVCRMIERWKEGTSVLRDRLRRYNDMMEDVKEDTDFPWPGASSITMGVGITHARTIGTTFDKSLFSGEKYLVMENTGEIKSSDKKVLEDAINWLGAHDNNMLDTLKDMAIPLFRDGTVPVMGEWCHDVEKSCDYKTYQDSGEFRADYPSSDVAGISEKRYNQLLKALDETYQPNLTIQYSYDQVVKDAPVFTKIPLARFCFFPLSAEELSECVIYGRQYYESVERAETNIRVGEYDSEPGREAINSAKSTYEDPWGHSREAAEGITSAGDDYKKLECYRLVLKQDLDGDGIPEKYLLSYDHHSKRILKIRRYYLRKNIDCIVLFRFLKRDGRLLGISLCGDGYDQYKMIDEFHRHRQNVRAITDSPAFLCPDRLKDTVDFGSEEYAWRPGATIYLPEDLMVEGKAPRQLLVQNLSRDNNSLDEESQVLRYLEMRVGPSQGMSGKESQNDPRQPATKTLALLKQSTFRVDQYLGEYKRSVPKLVALHNALYYQYGKLQIPYVSKMKGNPYRRELRKALLASEGLTFRLKIGEMSLSPEFKIEKSRAILEAVASFPMAQQLNPQIFIEAWNEYIYALNPSNVEAFLVELPKPGAQLPQMMQAMPQGMTPEIVEQNLQRVRERENENTGRRA